MQPLVSCVCPTKNRAATIKLAISSFQAQTYPRRELIIVDNGEDETEALIPVDPRIRYYKVVGPHTTGEMRNLCNWQAQGPLICHFDSDDWSADTRIETQVHLLGEKLLVGYPSILFYDVRDQQAYSYFHPRPLQPLGTSFCYHRSWWRAHPFEHLQIGEDQAFFKQAFRAHSTEVVLTAGGETIVALVHDQQTCRKRLQLPHYKKIDASRVPKAFTCALTSSVTFQTA